MFIIGLCAAFASGMVGGTLVWLAVEIQQEKIMKKR